MKKLILSLIIFYNFLYSAQVEELLWPKGESFLTFLDKYKISHKLYFDLEKEDKELCSEIEADRRFYLYTNDDGSLNQVLIPVSDDIQIHIYKDSNKNGYNITPSRKDIKDLDSIPWPDYEGNK